MSTSPVRKFSFNDRGPANQRKARVISISFLGSVLATSGSNLFEKFHKLSTKSKLEWSISSELLGNPFLNFPLLILLLGLVFVVLRPVRRRIDERGIWQTGILGLKHFPWSSVWRVDTEILKREPLAQSRPLNHTPPVPGTHAPAVKVTLLNNREFRICSGECGCELRELASAIDSALPEWVKRSPAFHAIAHGNVEILPTPVRSVDIEEFAKHFGLICQICLVLMSIMLSVGILANLDTFQTISFGALLMIPGGGLWMIRRMPHQTILKDTGVGVCRFGSEVAFIPWADITSIQAKSELVARARCANYVMGSFSSYQLHCADGRRATVAPYRFESLTSDLTVTLDALLPETCIRDQSFLGCLARAKGKSQQYG